MKVLKTHLYQRYHGFADARVTDLNLRDTFIVDERRRRATKGPDAVSDSFCTITAKVIGDDALQVSLAGNVPKSARLTQWVSKHHDIVTITKTQLTVHITLATSSILNDLAEVIADIVALGDVYPDPAYKFVCPSTAESLRALQNNLADCPSAGEGSAPQPSTLDLFS